jgi:hypothetical protein
MTPSGSAKIARSEAFRWSASLALPPALLGLPAASYAGMAAVNLLWHLAFGLESPALVYVIGGLFYGVTFGVLLQCFLFGIIGQLVWRISSHRLESMLIRMSQFVTTALWIGVEIIVIPMSFYMTMMAYGGPAFLSWLFRVDG